MKKEKNKEIQILAYCADCGYKLETLEPLIYIDDKTVDFTFLVKPCENCKLHENKNPKTK